MTQEHEVAIVTGAKEGGIGFATAKKLAQRFGDGGIVHLTARDGRDAIAGRDTLRREGLSVISHKLDVTRQVDVDRIMEKISRDGSPTILVDAAVIFDSEDRGEKITRVSMDSVRKTFEVNTLGVLRMIQAVIPGMVAAGYGRIVEVVGSWGKNTRALEELHGRGGAYGMSKAADIYLVASVASQMEKQGYNDVRINGVDPGKVRTNMNPGGTLLPDEAAVYVEALTRPEVSTSGVLYVGSQVGDYGTYVRNDGALAHPR
ncbi:MAG: SDR family oxidoreductase [Candidatus Levybacteria bacterium]|nr:SDR family oxidoreductase [Candidatus Levybacteria bacterium]